eukprot:6242484-Alexandrium_andersonii.AAC.1
MYAGGRFRPSLRPALAREKSSSCNLGTSGRSGRSGRRASLSSATVRNRSVAGVWIRTRGRAHTKDSQLLRGQGPSLLEGRLH